MMLKSNLKFFIIHLLISLKLFNSGDYNIKDAINIPELKGCEMVILIMINNKVLLIFLSIIKVISHDYYNNKH